MKQKETIYHAWTHQEIDSTFISFRKNPYASLEEVLSAAHSSEIAKDSENKKLAWCYKTVAVAVTIFLCLFK